jgi:hypothetical protein
VDVRAIPLGKLRAAEWNANRPGPELVRKLRRSLERFGLVSNLVVRKHPTRRGSFEVLSGNHRLELLLELGFDEAPCVVVDVDDARARLLAVTLNRGGENDPQAYAQLIADVVDALGSSDELIELLPETAESLDVALARLEALPAPAPQAGRYPLVSTWKLGFKLEAALACRRRDVALAAGEDAEALAWWYGHAFARASIADGDGSYFADFVDLDDAGVDLARVFRGGGEFVLALAGTSRRSMSAAVRKAAKAVGGELEVLAIDEHDDVVFGSWRSTS